MEVNKKIINGSSFFLEIAVPSRAKLFKISFQRVVK